MAKKKAKPRKTGKRVIGKKKTTRKRKVVNPIISCHSSQRAAETAQQKQWDKGRNARIIKRADGTRCVKDFGKRKKTVIRKTGQRLGKKR